jgi:glycosyltransferase involved in cell wall biosynthesis
MEVIYNFFEPSTPRNDRAKTRADLGIADDEIMILHSSNLRTVKRIDHLLQSVARIQPHDAYKLVLLAGGPFEPYRDQAQRLGIMDRIIIKENVLEIEEYLQAADIALYTSETESFCLSILEAMFFGCPSVTTRVGGIPEVVEDGKTGLLAPFADIDALGAALQRLVEDKDLRERYGEAARAAAHERFSAASIIPQYERLYENLLVADGIKRERDQDHKCLKYQ